MAAATPAAAAQPERRWRCMLQVDEGTYNALLGPHLAAPIPPYQHLEQERSYRDGLARQHSGGGRARGRGGAGGRAWGHPQQQFQQQQREGLQPALPQVRPRAGAQAQRQALCVRRIWVDRPVQQTLVCAPGAWLAIDGHRATSMFMQRQAHVQRITAPCHVVHKSHYRYFHHHPPTPCQRADSFTPPTPPSPHITPRPVSALSF